MIAGIIFSSIVSFIRSEYLKNNPKEAKEDINKVTQILKSFHLAKLYDSDNFKKTLDSLEYLKEKKFTNFEWCNEINKALLLLNDSHTKIVGSCTNTLDKGTAKKYKFNEMEVNQKKVNTIIFSDLELLHLDDYEKRIAKLKSIVSNSDILIIDITNCPGGHVIAADQIAAIIYGGELSYSIYYLSFPSPYKKVSTYFGDKLNKWRKEKVDERNLTINTPTTLSESEIDEDYLEIEKKLELKVLISKNTGSACKRLAQNLKSYPDVIYLGEPTNDSLSYGDSIFIDLNTIDSRLYISTTKWFLKENYSNIIIPDVKTDSPFARAIKDLK